MVLLLGVAIAVMSLDLRLGVQDTSGSMRIVAVSIFERRKLTQLEHAINQQLVNIHQSRLR